MKVYIQTDIEGCAGFIFFENRKDSSLENLEHRCRMRQLLTREVNAAVTGAFAAGASEVLVNDSHGSGYNIFFEDLDPRCEIIHGRNCSGPHWLPLFDSSFDALVLVGMHAMGGTEKAITPHSRWDINNGEMYLSEASMAAAIAGDFGVPTVFVSGDNNIVEEVREKIPSISSAVVKTALGTYQAKSVIPARACEMIKNGVTEGLKNSRNIAPFKISGPITLQLLDSEDHTLPLGPILEKAVTAETVSEAFMGCVEAMPWNSFNTVNPDGFQYP